MYIQNIFTEVNENKTAKQYRKELKEISSINLRRNSKFNVMAVYGVLKLLKNQSYPKNLAIYVASEYGCTKDMKDVLVQINDKDSIVMPFSFLNINTNNTGYYISQVLETTGNNINISAEDISFEKAFELAYFDFKYNSIKEILIGAVDESLENITNYNTMIHNIKNKKTYDGNAWFYLNNNIDNSLAEVKFFKQFMNINELNKQLENINYDIIGLNQFAKQNSENLTLKKDLIFNSKENNFYGTESASNIIELLKQEKESSIYISLDSKQRAYLFHFIKK